jgi:hypothetical protein
MLDDVATFLVVAPIASSLISMALVVAWLLGGRPLRPRRAARRFVRIETGAAVRKRI